MSQITVFTYWEPAVFAKVRRGSQKLQDTASYFRAKEATSVEKAIWYKDIAEDLQTDHRNLKKLLDKTPGFVRQHNTMNYYYLEEFSRIDEPNAYPYKFPRGYREKQGQVPRVVSSDFVAVPREIVATAITADMSTKEMVKAAERIKVAKEPPVEISQTADITTDYAYQYLSNQAGTLTIVSTRAGLSEIAESNNDLIAEMETLTTQVIQNMRGNGNRTAAQRKSDLHAVAVFTLTLAELIKEK